jgi:RNA polymerase sigma factor (sigma-70 family)
MSKPRKLAQENPFIGSCRELIRIRARHYRLLDSEDVEQDAFVRALSAANADSVRDPVRYFFRIARNLFIDRQRRKLRENAVYQSVRNTGEMRIDALNPERILLAKEELQRVTTAIGDLPPRCREAFVLHRFENLSYPAIARRMGVSAGTVEKHIAEAMLRITRAIRQTGNRR